MPGSHHEVPLWDGCFPLLSCSRLRARSRAICSRLSRNALCHARRSPHTQAPAPANAPSAAPMNKKASAHFGDSTNRPARAPIHAPKKETAHAANGVSSQPIDRINRQVVKITLYASLRPAEHVTPVQSRMRVRSRRCETAPTRSPSKWRRARSRSRLSAPRWSVLTHRLVWNSSQPPMLRATTRRPTPSTTPGHTKNHYHHQSHPTSNGRGSWDER